MASMGWINGFELMHYIIAALMVADLIRTLDYNGLFTFRRLRRLHMGVGGNRWHRYQRTQNLNHRFNDKHSFAL